MTLKISYITLGSNLDNPMQQVQTALAELAELPDTKLLTHSKLYLSRPLGPSTEDFVNAVAKIETRLKPHSLLDALQTVEDRHGRQRLQHWGARTLDLDIALYGEEIIHDARLTIPHPEIVNRDFALQPLYEIEPELVFPNGIRLEDMLGKCEKFIYAVNE